MDLCNEDERMKILIVASYNKNRFAPFIVEQAEALCAMGCEIEWFGVLGKGLSGYLRAIQALRTKIREWKPDVVHAHYGLSSLAANLATRRVPVVSTYHGSDINLAKVRPLSKMAMRLSAWNIFVSKRNMALVGAVEGKKCSLIPCGINLPQPWSELQKQKVKQLTLNQRVEGLLEKGRKHVLFAGAFDNAVKDSELAKQAVERMNVERMNDERLANVELVELKGYTREEVYALMYTCDALLMTSKTEGSPQVIKEAMACGCPIVSVDVGDVAERVANLDGCYVVPIDDRLLMIDKLAEALKKAIAFEGKTNGRERIVVDGVTIELVAKKIIEIYKSIIK